MKQASRRKAGRMRQDGSTTLAMIGEFAAAERYRRWCECRYGRQTRPRWCPASPMLSAKPMPTLTCPLCPQTTGFPKSHRSPRSFLRCERQVVAHCKDAGRPARPLTEVEPPSRKAPSSIPIRRTTGRGARRWRAAPPSRLAIGREPLTCRAAAPGPMPVS